MKIYKGFFNRVRLANYISPAKGASLTAKFLVTQKSNDVTV